MVSFLTRPQVTVKFLKLYCSSPKQALYLLSSIYIVKTKLRKNSGISRSLRNINNKVTLMTLYRSPVRKSSILQMARTLYGDREEGGQLFSRSPKFYFFEVSSKLTMFYRYFQLWGRGTIKAFMQKIPAVSLKLAYKL